MKEAISVEEIIDRCFADKSNLSETSEEQTIKKDAIEKEYSKFITSCIIDGPLNIKRAAEGEAAGIEFSKHTKKEKLNIVEWEPNKDCYPRFMLLGTDKGILAYMEFFVHEQDGSVPLNVSERYSICYDYKKLRQDITYIESDLDRPTFFIHVLLNKKRPGILFETEEMIKDKILNGTVNLVEYKGTEYYFSDLTEMGSLSELLETFCDLKKNNVKMY